MMKYILYIIFMAGAVACPNKPGKEAPAAPEKKISRINFFMEVSGSMAGYMNGATGFSSTMPNLLVEMSGKIDSGRTPLHNYMIAASIMPFRGRTEDFIRKLSTENPAKEKSSEMHKIFRMVANNTDSNDISIFTSDCILSYPDEIIKRRPEINKMQADGELKSNITQTFLDLQKKNDMCASLYVFNSTYNGKYYTYQNNYILLRGDVLRPYYLWVIGNRDLLLKFNSRLKQLQHFKPVYSMDFGLYASPANKYSILFSHEKKGSWSTTDYTTLKNVSATKNKPAVFAIALDLHHLPAYATDTGYLLKNLQSKSQGLAFSILRVTSAAGIDRASLRNKEQKIIDTSTHVILIQITSIFNDEGNIELELPLKYDTLYKKFSTMDDRKKDSLAGKTFAFEHLVDGVRTAYEDLNQRFIHISIPVKK